MNNNCEEKKPHCEGHHKSGSGLLLVVVLYILLAIILGSGSRC